MNLILGLTNQYALVLDLKIIVGYCDLYFNVCCFTLYLEDYLMYKHASLGYCVSILQNLAAK